MNNLAERDVIDITVNEFRARRISEGLLNQPLNRLVVTTPAIL